MNVMAGIDAGKQAAIVARGRPSVLVAGQVLFR